MVRLCPAGLQEYPLAQGLLGAIVRSQMVGRG